METLITKYVESQVERISAAMTVDKFDGSWRQTTVTYVTASDLLCFCCVPVKKKWLIPKNLCGIKYFWLFRNIYEPASSISNQQVVAIIFILILPQLIQRARCVSSWLFEEITKPVYYVCLQDQSNVWLWSSNIKSINQVPNSENQ